MTGSVVQISRCVALVRFAEHFVVRVQRTIANDRWIKQANYRLENHLHNVYYIR